MRSRASWPKPRALPPPRISFRRSARNLEWDWGALWSFDREPRSGGCPAAVRLLVAHPDIDAAEFDAATRERSFAAGEGRLGQVWRTIKPIWMTDATTEPEFLRAGGGASGAAWRRHF